MQVDRAGKTSRAWKRADARICDRSRLAAEHVGDLLGRRPELGGASQAGEVIGFALVTRHFFGFPVRRPAGASPRRARRRGVGLSADGALRGGRTTPTASSRPPTRAMRRCGRCWPRPAGVRAGVVHYLDPGDPELFFVKFRLERDRREQAAVVALAAMDRAAVGEEARLRRRRCRGRSTRRARTPAAASRESTKPGRSKSRFSAARRGAKKRAWPGRPPAKAPGTPAPPRTTPARCRARPPRPSAPAPRRARPWLATAACDDAGQRARASRRGRRRRRAPQGRRSAPARSRRPARRRSRRACGSRPRRPPARAAPKRRVDERPRGPSGSGSRWTGPRWLRPSAGRPRAAVLRDARRIVAGAAAGVEAGEEPSETPALAGEEGVAHAGQRRQQRRGEGQGRRSSVRLERRRRRARSRSRRP